MTVTPGDKNGGRAEIIGVGLVGGSIGMALRRRGWHVTGRDREPARAARGVEVGALDAVGSDADADVTFVATPVGAVADEARRTLALASGRAARVVTDVGSVKAPIVSAVAHSRFVGGHPMAGSEQEGVDGADPDLFAGATWVLTPTPGTDGDAYLRVRQIVASLGADVVAVTPEHHDELVAVVSHVPHLTAATLMSLAADAGEEHATLLRLAAGGFRDMTRIAAGHPGIWPDICAENRDAITSTLDRLVAALTSMRATVASADRDGLLDLLERARHARLNLPIGTKPPEELVEVRVRIADKPGEVAQIATLAGELGVNIENLDIAHSAEGSGGVLTLVIDVAHGDLLRGALFARGYRASIQPLA